MATFPIQLIDSQGHFKEDDLKSFLAQTNFFKRGESYRVVSIFGPQSSGKSTLLNELCGTNFKVRENFRQFQTTQGIWMAKCDLVRPFTIAIDMEGTDGSVKEGNTTFDNQSALFALEISDVVLINMEWKAVGRNEAAGRTLLKIILQFSFEEVEGHLKRDIRQIWDGVPKPDAHKDADLSVFFNVEVIALSSYWDKQKQFKQEVAELRKRLFSSVSTSLGGPVTANRQVVSASDFSANAHEIWKQIRQIPDLDIPSIQLDEAIQAGPQEFDKRLRSILETCCLQYDEETKYYDERIRTDRRKYLEAKALQLFQPAFTSMLNHLFGKASEIFQTSLEKSRNKGLDFATSLDIAEQFCVHECKQGLEGWANWGDSSTVQSIVMDSIKRHASLIKSTYQTKSQRDSVRSAEIALRAAFGIVQIVVTGVTAGTFAASGGACSIM